MLWAFQTLFDGYSCVRKMRDLLLVDFEDFSFFLNQLKSNVIWRHCIACCSINLLLQKIKSALGLGLCAIYTSHRHLEHVLACPVRMMP